MRVGGEFLPRQTAEMYPQASHGSNRILHLGTESSSQLYKSLSKQPLGHNKAKSGEEGSEQCHFWESSVEVEKAKRAGS